MDKFFRGAGVIVVPAESTETNDKGDIFVRTKYAALLSRVMNVLKIMYEDKIDYFSKYDFYGFIAETYNELIKENGDVLENIGELLDCMGRRYD